MKSARAVAEHEESIAAMETLDHPDEVTTDRRAEAMGRDLEQLPPGYFYSARFIGSYCVGDIPHIQDTKGAAGLNLYRRSASPLPVALVAFLWLHRS